jgi:hypothetical protein
VARNAIVDNGRAKREPPVDAPDEVASDEGPAERAESGWVAWRVHRALAELPENERQVTSSPTGAAGRRARSLTCSASSAPSRTDADRAPGQAVLEDVL